jgi:RNA polymerase sigma-54 factor
MLKQFLNLKLSQKLSPQQIQLMKLIQLPTQAFEQRLLRKWTKIQLWNWKRKDYEKDEFENEDWWLWWCRIRIEAEDINIDEYLSNDETPDYKTQTSNYTMMMIAKHHLLPVSFHQI